MKYLLTTVVAGLLITINPSGGCQTMKESAEPLHLSTSFHFEIDTPFSTAALLFGPESEKRWAGEHWQPQFFYPQPGEDTVGAVFTVAKGPHTSIWVTTIYDVPNGKMQYVAIIPQVVASVIDVRLTSVNSTKTRVDVTYTRTALDAAANGDVRDLAHHDAISGPEWQKAIQEYLAIRQ
jgi:hypothetical protein